MVRRTSILSACGVLYGQFLDPVFVKDLEGLSRRWRLYAGRMLHVGLVAATVYVFLVPLGGASSTSLSANLGRTLFGGLVTLQMAYVTIAMAHLAADLLLREARTGTLQLMLLTPLSGWRIAFGKWKAVMAHATTLILAGLPPLGITAYLGGTSPWDLLWSSWLSLALAGLSSALSLYCALTSRTAVRATVAAALAILLSGVLLLGTAGVLHVIFRSSWIMFAASLLHPGVAAVGAANATYFGGFTGYAWIGAVVLALALAQVFLMSAAGHLSISSTLDELLAPRGMAASERAPGLPSLENRTVWDRHPLLWKEIALQTISRLGWTRRTTVAALLPLLLLLSTPLSWNQSILGGYLVVLTGLAMIVGSGLFIRDKEGRHLEVLLTLPVSSGQVVGAKLLSGVCTVEGGAYLIWTVLMLEFALGDRLYSDLTLSVVVLMFLLFSYALAALASLHLQTSRAAFLAAALVVWGTLMGLPILREMLPGTALALAHPTVLGEGIVRAEGGASSSILPFLTLYGAATSALVGAMIFGFRRQLR